MTENDASPDLAEQFVAFLESVRGGAALVEYGEALGEAVAIRPEGERRLRARTVPPPERMPRGMRAVAR